MVTQIQLGNFFTSGGKTVPGGVGGSGLDTQSLIEGLVEARRLPAVRIEEKITAGQARNAALVEYRTLLSTFRDAVNFMRNPPGVANDVDNVFRYTTSSLSSSTATGGRLRYSSSPSTFTGNVLIEYLSSLRPAPF